MANCVLHDKQIQEHMKGLSLSHDHSLNESREAAVTLAPSSPPVFILGLRVYKLNALQYTHPPRAVRVTNKVGVACYAFLSFGLAVIGSFQVSSPRCPQGAVCPDLCMLPSTYAPPM